MKLKFVGENAVFDVDHVIFNNNGENENKEVDNTKSYILAGTLGAVTVAAATPIAAFRIIRRKKLI